MYYVNGIFFFFRVAHRQIVNGIGSCATSQLKDVNAQCNTFGSAFSSFLNFAGVPAFFCFLTSFYLSFVLSFSLEPYLLEASDANKSIEEHLKLIKRCNPNKRAGLLLRMLMPNVPVGDIECTFGIRSHSIYMLCVCLVCSARFVLQCHLVSSILSVCKCEANGNIFLCYHLATAV